VGDGMSVLNPLFSGRGYADLDEVLKRIREIGVTNGDVLKSFREAYVRIITSDGKERLIKLAYRGDVDPIRDIEDLINTYLLGKRRGIITAVEDVSEDDFIKFILTGFNLPLYRLLWDTGSTLFLTHLMNKFGYESIIVKVKKLSKGYSLVAKEKGTCTTTELGNFFRKVCSNILASNEIHISCTICGTVGILGFIGEPYKSTDKIKDKTPLIYMLFYKKSKHYCLWKAELREAVIRLIRLFNTNKLILAYSSKNGHVIGIPYIILRRC